jgi:hypothetical protein
MSLLDAPLAVIDRLISRRTPPIGADDPAARLVVRASARLRPDPKFRKQLRTSVLNRYVAVRDGHVAPAPRRSEMGRLGRAVLYATFALVVGVSSAGAASSSSLPGDALYTMKLRLEAVRMQIAPPVARPMLAELALSTRLSELEQLAAAGRWDKIPGAAAAVGEAEKALEALGGPSADEVANLARHTDVLTQLLAGAPEEARAGLEHAITASASHLPGAAPDENGQGGQSGASGSAGQGGNAAGGQPAATPTPTPSKSPHPTRSPKATPSVGASAQPTPRR